MMWCDSDGVADGCDNDFKGGNVRNLISVMAVLNSINCVDSAQRHPFATIIPCNLLKFNNVPAINKPIASSKFHYVYFTRVLLAEFVFIIPSLSELPEIEFIFTACNITENSDRTTPTLQRELTGRIFSKNYSPTKLYIYFWYKYTHYKTAYFRIAWGNPYKDSKTHSHGNRHDMGILSIFRIPSISFANCSKSRFSFGGFRSFKDSTRTNFQYEWFWT